ncbi:MAG: DNA topoisomerase 4 subunit A [Anaerolineaceae bacterium]|nr:DNA topoisomerase 4 subunit A [Anaerolineaceae bacterium]
MDLGSIKQVNINDEMQHSYLDYAMSTIVSRALPDARDGLKPVQRRILYAMFDMGLRSDTAHKKSARIVGEVLGKYHPHGDMAVYEAMARMAQDFSERYLLVDGQGNFGSVDGDPPAAMRYTEARLTDASMDILRQLDMDTVDYNDNFDGSLKEPKVLPSAIPNLLINGASGIAVGMATNIPPHNLGEIVDALILMLESWEKLDDISVEDLMRFVKGPDFPTGALIIQDDNSDHLAQIYGTGNGKVKMRARVRMEEMSRGRMRIIVSELPFMTNKSTLIERIADLTRNGTLEGIVDLRDESDRHGMRIVIEMSKSADPEKILGILYKKTPMQETFGINLLALVNGEPHKLSLKQALKVYAEHRLEVIRRRSEFELRRNEARLHILVALRIALLNLDEVINIIRHSQRVETARLSLMKRFKLDEIQVNAILDMPLRKLASLERKKIEEEYQEVADLIKAIKALLKSDKKMRQVVIDELKEVRSKYGDARRTQIIRLEEGFMASDLLTQTDVMPEESFWVAFMSDGRISRTVDDNTFRMSGLNAPWNVIRTSSHHTIFLVTTEGKSTAIHSLSIPVQSSPDEGVMVHTISSLDESDIVINLFSVPMDAAELPDVCILSVSRSGMVKKSIIQDLPGPSASAFTLVKVNEADELFSVLFAKPKEDVLITSANGMTIRFNEEEVRPMGLVAVGVNGMKLKDDDFVIGTGIVSKGDSVIVMTNDGSAKRIEESEFPVQGRYGQGVITWKLTDNEKVVVQLIGKLGERAICHFEKAASKFFKISDAPLRSRMAKGKNIIDVKTKDEIIGFTKINDMVDYWEKI